MSNPQEHKGEAPGQNKEYSIIVNGRPRTVTEHRLSFLEVVRLAYPNAVPSETMIYTVTYRKGEDRKPEGTLVEGESVTIKSGMIFNVTETNKS